MSRHLMSLPFGAVPSRRVASSFADMPPRIAFTCLSSLVDLKPFRSLSPPPPDPLRANRHLVPSSSPPSPAAASFRSLHGRFQLHPLFLQPLPPRSRRSFPPPSPRRCLACLCIRTSTEPRHSRFFFFLFFWNDERSEEGTKASKASEWKRKRLLKGERWHGKGNDIPLPPQAYQLEGKETPKNSAGARRKGASAARNF